MFGSPLRAVTATVSAVVLAAACLVGLSAGAVDAGPGTCCRPFSVQR